MKKNLVNAFTQLALAILCISMIPACGGGGGNSGSAGATPPTPPVATVTSTHLHRSANDPSVKIFPPAGGWAGFDHVIRQITFTPLNVDDVVASVEVVGFSSYSGATPTTVGIVVLDGLGSELDRHEGLLGAPNGAFRLSTSFEGSLKTIGRRFGNATYTIQLIGRDVPASSGGNIHDTQFNIVTHEGVTVEAPSPLIQ